MIRSNIPSRDRDQATAKPQRRARIALTVKSGLRAGAEPVVEYGYDPQYTDDGY